MLFFHRRFQPTYKELKPAVAMTSACLSCGFQPTYKELKPITLKPADIAYDSFQPTYKELKPQFGNMESDGM